jgi:hypothetical protein
MHWCLARAIAWIVSMLSILLSSRLLASSLPIAWQCAALQWNIAFRMISLHHYARCFGLAAAVVALIAAGPTVAAEEPPCTGADLELANRAAAQSKAMLDKAIAAIDNPKPADLNRLKTWFGIVDSSAAQKVRQILVKARVHTDGGSYRCAVNTNIKIGDVYAYVRPDQSFVIVLGAFFLNASDTGFNSRPGVLIHEMTHFILAGATKDTIYGVDGARRLAAQNPAAAQKNADNFEYFVEATAFNLQ